MGPHVVWSSLLVLPVLCANSDSPSRAAVSIRAYHIQGPSPAEFRLKAILVDFFSKLVERRLSSCMISRALQVYWALLLGACVHKGSRAQLA
jgi:hypothetical protein